MENEDERQSARLPESCIEPRCDAPRRAVWGRGRLDETLASASTTRTGNAMLPQLRHPDSSWGCLYLVAIRHFHACPSTPHIASLKSFAAQCCSGSSAWSKAFTGVFFTRAFFAMVQPKTLVRNQIASTTCFYCGANGGERSGMGPGG